MAAAVTFDEGLAQRIRDLVGQGPETAERRMFGGWGLMLKGNLLVGVIGDHLIARVGPDAYTTCLREPGAREFDFTGRPMKGWVQVDAEALDEDADLETWLARCTDFVTTLPAK